MMQIAQQIVENYPIQLQKGFEGSIVGSGYDGFLAKLMSRIENIRRPNDTFGTFSSVRSSVIRRKRVLLNDQKELNCIDGFGCVNWMPVLPDGESNETQLEDKLSLQRINKRGEWDKDTVKILSTDINGCMTVVSLQVEWPFIFQEDIFHTHVNQLLGFELHDRLLAAFKQKGPRLIAFFKTVKSLQHCAILQQLNNLTADNVRGNVQLIAAFTALLYFMKEDLSILCQITDLS